MKITCKNCTHEKSANVPGDNTCLNCAWKDDGTRTRFVPKKEDNSA